GEVTQLQGMHVIFGKVALCECHRNFAPPVCPEIKANHYIAIFYCCYRRSKCIRFNYRFDEFIGYPIAIRLLDGMRKLLAWCPDAVNEQIISLLDALPAIVAVHGIIPPDH